MLLELPFDQRASSGLRLETLGFKNHLARLTGSGFIFIILLFQLLSIYYDNDFPFTAVI